VRPASNQLAYDHLKPNASSLVKLALLSDIHSNVQAFDACVADANARGATQFALLGDFVGYAADPRAIVQRVMAMVDAGAWAIKGNHDEMACHVPPQTATPSRGEMTAAWTNAQLSDGELAFLDALPLTHQDGSLLLVHASADTPERWRYVYDARGAAASLDAAVSLSADIRYVFGGHVHEQTLYYQGRGHDLLQFMPTRGVPIPVSSHRRWVATVGSVGQPRDGRAEAMYAWFDRDASQITFVRVPYDHSAAAAAIRATGLPDFFADRLARGE
jgi:diadenosine tetraphosphatase ApaH/serine/threonine PP2A family protein phosphatase